MRLSIALQITVFFISLHSFGQATLTTGDMESGAIRFSLSEQNKIEGNAREQILNLVGENQFVGIAEVHNSQQLGRFTAGLLELLREKEFNHLALEMGPHSAKVLSEISGEPKQVGAEIKNLNHTYGKNRLFKIPLIFVARKADTVFVKRAAELSYNLWGLDQEYAGSFEMHIDRLFQLHETKSSEVKKDYEAAKAAVRKNIFKEKVKGQSVYCWYQSNELIANFFGHFPGNKKAQQLIQDIQISWDIYCKSATGGGSNQQRANYMKKNFEQYYQDAKKNDPSPKILFKLGGIHLTHGSSAYGVDDMGKYLHEKAVENNTGFLSIRNLITYRNGKSNIGKSGWRNVEIFLELGRKDQWTLVDLRPFRDKVLKGELSTTKQVLHELASYDLLLIPPDDKVAKLNY